jgi:hypothetical protein
MLQFYDPYSGMSGGLQNVSSEFGWYPNGTNYVLTPLYADLLRIQQLDFNQEIRKSAYSFELNGGMLKLFPLPQYPWRIWFDFTLTTERDYPFIRDDEASGSMSDFSDVNYQQPVYSKINAPGRQWIRNYGLALSKEMLGLVRGKYQTIPSPKEPIMLDGANLRSESAAEKTALITSLTTMLQAIMDASSFKNQKEQNDNLNSLLAGMPLPLFLM